MAKTSTKKSSLSKTDPAQSFEKLMSELEKRVNLLEQENLDLNKAIDVFKEAAGYAREARRRLKEAQQVINNIIENEEDELEK